MIQTLSLLIQRTRQHHAIEHAAIHLLTARHRDRRFSGLSDPLGFTLLANVEQAQVQRAVTDAMMRLQAGQHDLAIHPNCGTNLAVTALFVSVAGLLGASGGRGLAEKFSTTLILVLGALLLSKPLGFRVQAYTTLAQITDRWLVDVQEISLAGQRAFRVTLE